ncbi:MAG TPA: ATP-grasp domain-containing protein [Pirellulales bacterium]
MTTPTLVLTPRFTPDSQALWRAGVELGWNVERLAGWRVSEALRRTPNLVLYLEGLLGPSIAEQLGIRLEKPPVDWLPRLPEEYRRRWVTLSTLGEARSLVEPAFIKPPNEKSFPARVYRGSELPTDYDDETPVLVAEVVHWTKEFRCFVLERGLATFSVYLRDGELQQVNGFAHTSDEATEVQEFVGRLLDDPRVDLPPAAVVDVGVIRDRGWAVIEQNAAWASGVYGCDPRRVLEVLKRACNSSPRP